MATPQPTHHFDRASEPLPASAAHRVLAILAGDPVPDTDVDAVADGLARFIIRQGWGRLAPDQAEADGSCGSSPWFVRVTFPGIPPPDPFIVAVATAAGFRVQWLAQGPPASARFGGTRGGAVTPPSRWLLVAPQPRDAVSSAAARLLAAHRIHAVPFRKIEDR
jgi:hypothetical protein